jgi:hypothetical protein
VRGQTEGRQYNFDSEDTFETELERQPLNEMPGQVYTDTSGMEMSILPAVIWNCSVEPLFHDAEGIPGAITLII